MKIYLCKSMQSDPAMLDAVREGLQGKHELVEYTGGKYSREPMLSCDALIMVPPKDPAIDDKGSATFIFIGSGQLSEISEWFEKQEGKQSYLFQNPSAVHKILAFTDEHYEIEPKSAGRNSGSVALRSHLKPKPLSEIF